MRSKLFLIAALIFGCATVGTPSPPAWIALGSGAYLDGGTRFFFGVGTKSDIKLEELRRMAAEAQARAELARTLDTFLTDVLQSFPTPAPSLATEDDNMGGCQPGLKALVEEQIRIAAVTERWSPSDQQTDVVRVRLSFDAFLAALSARTDIPEKPRARLVARARQRSGASDSILSTSPAES